MKTEPGKKICSPARIVLTPVSSAGDVSGRELDALERRAEHVRRRPREQRLRAAGRAFEQDVPARQRSDEQQLDRALLSDHDLRDLDLRALAQFDEALVRRLHKQCHDRSLPVRLGDRPPS